MTSVEFVSDVTVELVRSCAADEFVVQAARVSTKGSNTTAEDNAGLINYLMKGRHGSPFEHTMFTFKVEAPIFVWREHHRHRIGFSYNEESGRYKELAPRFYRPSVARPMVQVGKPGHYTMTHGTLLQDEHISAAFDVAEEAYEQYQGMLDGGIAREVARMVLPVNIMSTCFVTCNARSLMSFLSLRTDSPDATFPSHPQREIEMVAEKYEDHFKTLMPNTHAAFVKNGRVAP